MKNCFVTDVRNQDYFFVIGKCKYTGLSNICICEREDGSFVYRSEYMLSPSRETFHVPHLCEGSVVRVVDPYNKKLFGKKFLVSEIDNEVVSILNPCNPSLVEMIAVTSLQVI